jgi:tripartite-type tricarboxylate transporter receptor subunit TctC
MNQLFALSANLATLLLPAAACALTMASSRAAAQEAYPAKPIRIVLPVAAGGGTDALTRMIGQGLLERWGKQVVVENRPGAGTIIASDIVAKAKPDGYTLLMTTSTHVINATAYRKMPYDTLRDFAPITQGVSLPSLLVVHPSVAKSAKELIALAKGRPGEILYASAGRGSNPHLAMALFAHMAQIRMVHVPYKSGPPALIDLLAGHVAVYLSGISSSLVHARSGRLRALGVSSARRAAAAPEIPTIAEAALPGYEAMQWYGLLAPAGTPREIIAMLHKEAAATLRTPENVSRFANEGAEVVASTPEAFDAFIRAESVKWAQVAKAAGISPE